jgi:hypothetical protein
VTQWLDAYQRWPAEWQMSFSVICLFAAILLVFMVGMWTLRVGQHLGSRTPPPPEKQPPTQPPAQQAQPKVSSMAEINALLLQILKQPATPDLPPPQQVPGLDWRRETRQLAEEREYEAQMRAQAEEQMRQAAK